MPGVGRTSEVVPRLQPPGDEFVLNVLDLDEPAVARVVQQQAAALKKPRRTAVELLGVLRQQGLPGSVAKLARLLAP